MRFQRSEKPIPAAILAPGTALLPSARIADLLKQLIALGILVAFGGLLFVAWRRRRLAAAFIAVTLVLAALWAAAYTAISKDYRDADGWVDCWPSCSTFQNAVGGTFILGPAAFVVLGTFAATLGAITALRGRERESPPPG